jgi:hypothetical protein
MRKSLKSSRCTVTSKNRKIGKPYFGILSLSIVMFSAPSEAHCYRYWHYKTPQHCGYSPTGRGIGLKIHQVRVQLPLSAPIDNDNDHSWFVEITKVPTEDNTDLDLREVGVEKLKQQLK